MRCLGGYSVTPTDLSWQMPLYPHHHKGQVVPWKLQVYFSCHVLIINNPDNLSTAHSRVPYVCEVAFRHLSQ